MEGSLSRRFLVPAAALLLLLILIAWATTHVSFSSGPAVEEPKEDPAIKARAARQAAIAESKRNYPASIDYQRLDSRLQRLAEQNNMVGLAVGVVENGEIRFLKGYGETTAGSGDPVTANTIFRWASVSKGVAGNMIAKLAERERLSLTDPVSKYAASMRLPGGNEHRATIADVLTHRLGIYGHAYDSRLEDGQNARHIRSSLVTLNNICAPGQCHAYQNVAYDAASEIVEKVTGKPYEQAVREQLFLPLGMSSATISREGLLNAPSWAKPHRGGKNSKPVEVTDSYYRVPAAGGVNSSIKDLALWMQAQMGLATHVLSQDVLQTVQAPRADTPRQRSRMRKFRERIGDASYGLGWRVFDYDGHTVIGHHGGVTGYRSLIMFDPQRKSGVVAFWNSSTAQPNGLEIEVMDMVYGLPGKDWLALDGKAGQQAIEPQATDEEVVTDSGS